MRYRNYIPINNAGDADFPSERFLYPEIVPDINSDSNIRERIAAVTRDPKVIAPTITRVKPTSIRLSSSDRASRSSFDRSKPYSQAEQQESATPSPVAASNKTFMIVAIAAVGLTLVYITIKKLAS